MTVFVAALRVALGSLYQDDVLLEPVGAVSVLAAATLLSLVGVSHSYKGKRGMSARWGTSIHLIIVLTVVCNSI